ncbi:MAG: galactose-1-phosphate uridylyltransferase [Desulfobacteraceae bacterium]|nr:galactose-1-phosphate uridylyltransferase [Desulfobacteraceae bacterium]
MENGEVCMGEKTPAALNFHTRRVVAVLRGPGGEKLERPVEIRTHPITGRSCRITFSRKEEKESGTETLPPPPPEASASADCPFCPGRLAESTPCLDPRLDAGDRLRRGRSVLFPNLFPYASHSAVSLFDERHFTEIGTAPLSSYLDSLANCRHYLQLVKRMDPEAVFMAITQNHLPSAGGSLLHPHLQVHADTVAANHHRFYTGAADAYHRNTGRLLFSDYMEHERSDGSRWIGTSGDWGWMAAFAPEGFYEIWGILPGRFSLTDVSDAELEQLARGILSAQRFFRSLCRNGYNLGILSSESSASRLELRAVLTVRSNYAPWVRNDHTGFEVMLGDMATFVPPEETAGQAKPWFGDL